MSEAREGGMLTPELREQAEELIGRYPGKRSALLPLLHLVQHVDGYVSDDGISACAELLGLTKAEVAAVATFYSMYKRAPLGRHLVSVCTNFSCKVRGGAEVYRHLSEKLGVGHNDTTEDGAITLEHAECLGNCEGAPVVSVDYLNYEGMTPESAADLVDALVAGEAPPPTRGFPPPGVRAVQHRLAGLGPIDGGPGAASSHARGHHGAVPLPASGPGVVAVRVEPAFGEGHAAEREQAKDAVRASGHDPEDVQAEAGPRAREFPTTDPDDEPPLLGDEPGAGEGDEGVDAGGERRSDERSEGQDG